MTASIGFACAEIAQSFITPDLTPARPTRELGRLVIDLPQHADQHRRGTRSSSQSISSSAKVRLAVRSRRRAVSNSSPAPWSGFRTGESGAYGGEGGRMIAAISIGIVIIIAVIIAALAIIYFILKESPR
jgi:hypothetical protein